MYKEKNKQFAYNPYLPPWEYIPDGEPYVFGEKIYVYGSHDLYDAETFCMGDYVCWSAPVSNPGDWHYEGVIYQKTEDPLNRDGKMCLYAPDVTVGPDGRYYLYYVLDRVSVVSVAVCDTPSGSFQFYGYVRHEDGSRLGERKGDEPQFDPGVLTEDGKTYLYTGFCPSGDRTRTGAKLTVLGPDMLTVVREPETVIPGIEYSRGTGFEGHAYFEAASIREKDGIYYLIYSSEVMHELCWAYGPSPAGPFTYGGVLISNCDIGIDSYKPAGVSTAYGANNHGSIVQIGDRWAVFYHRHTNGTWYSRQGCAEFLKCREIGFEQAEMTSGGLSGGILPGSGEYPAYIACNLFTEEHRAYVEQDAPRIVQERTNEGKTYSYIRGILGGTTVGFKYFDCRDVRGIRIRTRAYADGVFEVRTEYEGKVLGTIPVVNQNVWTPSECLFDDGRCINGKKPLYLTFKGTGKCSLVSFEFLCEGESEEPAAGDRRRDEAAAEARSYRNVFAQIGISEAEIEEKLNNIVQTFFYDEQERIYHEAEDDMGYLEDTGNHDARTEGMSYGMMLCVQLDMKAEFDRIWKWAKTFMYMEEGENEGYFAWSCQTDGIKNAYGPAPDGEEYFAMALFFAAHRWGNGEGIFNYEQEARAILRACLHKGENGRSGNPMWNRENHLILFVPGSPFSDPSYHLPHFYELFALWADEEDRPFWAEAAKASRQYLVKACHPVTGLNPEYGWFDGTPVEIKMEWGEHHRFFSDAYRTCANIGLDALWFGKDEGQLSAPLRQMRFLRSDLEAARCVYETDGRPTELTVLHPTGLLAATAQGALSVSFEENALPGSDWDTAAGWVKWFWEQPLRKGERRYYDNCLYLFAFLALAGRYRVW